MSERPCPLCGDTQSAVLFAEARIDSCKLDSFAFASRKLPEYMHHRLLLCRACDMVFASPVPDVTELRSAYEAAAFDSQTEAQFAARTYARLLRPYFARLPNKQGALDIGTGDGAFLSELLAAGFDEVRGIERGGETGSAWSDRTRLLRVGTVCSGEMFAGHLLSNDRTRQRSAATV